MSELNKEAFDKAIKEQKIIRWFDHFKAVTESYVKHSGIVEENEKLKSINAEMLEMLKYFTAFPDEDFDEFSYNDKFEMTVMTHKIAEAKQLIQKATPL